MTLYLVGGAPSEALGAVFDAFVSDARSRGQRIAVALLGSQDEVADYLDSYADPVQARYPEALIEPIWLVDEDDDGHIDWPIEPENLAGIIVGGGWTPGYLEALGTQRDLIARLVRSGVPYLGFSAGAMIASKHAIVGGWKHRGRQIAPEVASEGTAELDVRDGLGLIGTAVDTHADTWTVLDRAVAALLDGPLTSVASIDETTCLVIDAASGRTTVLGDGRVTWVSREGEQVVVRPQHAVRPDAD